MGILFNFSRLLEKYSVNCTLLCGSTDGRYEAGNWMSGADKEEPVTGAIIPMTERKIFQSGGTYTEQDREFITAKSISLDAQRYLVYKGMKYQVQGNTDYSDYAGFYSYNLKRVGAFDRAETNKSDHNRRT